MQAVPSSPLFAGASTKEQVDALPPARSTAADVAATSETTSHERTTTRDTTVVKPVPEPPKPSGKQTVKDSVPSKHASSLFTDDHDADDLFATPASSKVVAVLHQWHSTAHNSVTIIQWYDDLQGRPCANLCTCT